MVGGVECWQGCCGKVCGVIRLVVWWAFKTVAVWGHVDVREVGVVVDIIGRVCGGRIGGVGRINGVGVGLDGWVNGKAVGWGEVGEGSEGGVDELNGVIGCGRRGWRWMCDGIVCKGISMEWFWWS